MDKLTAIRIIEIDEALCQLSFMLNIRLNKQTFEYITDKINELLTEKIKLHDSHTPHSPNC